MGSGSSGMDPAWRDVEVRTHGPFPASRGLAERVILTMRDRTSGCITGAHFRSSSSMGSSGEAFNFFWSNLLLTFGPARCHFYDPQLLANFSGRFEAAVAAVVKEGIILAVSGNGPSLFTAAAAELFAMAAVRVGDDGGEDPLTSGIRNFVRDHPRVWDNPGRLEAWLFRKRTADGGPSPFRTLFESAEGPKVVADKFNVDLAKTTERAAEIDPASTRSRAATAPEGTAPGKVLPAQEPPRRTSAGSGPVVAAAAATVSSGAMAAAARTAAMAARSGERESGRRRGKYLVLDNDLRERVARRASERGPAEAARHFSQVLGARVSANTVSNILDRYRGGTASTAGAVPDPAAAVPGSAAVGSLGIDAGMRDQIGRYAFHCGVANAVRFFSAKLQISLKTGTVRKIRNQWAAAAGSTVPHQLGGPGRQQHPKSVAGADDRGHPGQGPRQQGSPTTSSSSGPRRKPGRPRKPTEGASSKQPAKKYASYDSALKRDIKAFATDHSTLDTIRHFKETAGLDLPGSTVRRLRNARLASADLGAVGDVSGGPEQLRGRPSKLGKYDDAVKTCLVELMGTGQKVTPFAVIAAAKHVLLEREPDLLEENGGPVALHQSWAKTFLNRVKNCSTTVVAGN